MVSPGLEWKGGSWMGIFFPGFHWHGFGRGMGEVGVRARAGRWARLVRVAGGGEGYEACSN